MATQLGIDAMYVTHRFCTPTGSAARSDGRYFRFRRQQLGACALGACNANGGAFRCPPFAGEDAKPLFLNFLSALFAIRLEIEQMSGSVCDRTGALVEVAQNELQLDHKLLSRAETDSAS